MNKTELRKGGITNHQKDLERAQDWYENVGNERLGIIVIFWFDTEIIVFEK